MIFNWPTLVTVVLVAIGGVISFPVLAKGFKRHGTGVKYEKNFSIQRAPQFLSLFNVALITTAFLFYNNILPDPGFLRPWFIMDVNPESGPAQLVSWIGVALLFSGFVFMIGGWYSLGELFTTDAEVLEGHKVKNTGLLSVVMHPAYSGITQCLLGSSLAATSPFCALFAALAVAPMWLTRAKYEEKILIESLGTDYQAYAESMKWRRLVPRIFPIGV